MAAALKLARTATVLALIALVAGCKPSGPTSTHTTSAAMPTLAARVAFVQEYVTFRRTYETLDFDVNYTNNGGGGVPGPSDWDVRLVATVPAGEVAAWVPPGVARSAGPVDRAWLKTVPTSLDLSGVDEWYEDGRRVVGVDRGRRIVAYRSWKN